MICIGHAVQGLGSWFFERNDWIDPSPGLQDLVHDDWPGFRGGGVLTPDNTWYAQKFSEIIFLSG